MTDTTSVKPLNPIPSSSPAFATPVHPLKALPTRNPPPWPVALPVSIPIATLRPLAFRTFTKKYGLTLTTPALQALATFIGKSCGSGWREEGLGEQVLEEVARTWKKNGLGVIVEGDGELRGILSALAGSMTGGKMMQRTALSRTPSLLASASGSRAQSPDAGLPGERNPPQLQRGDSQASFGMSRLDMAENDMVEESERLKDPRQWLKVINAFEQPRIVFNVSKRSFERVNTAPSLLPPAIHKTRFFQNRYHVVHRRVLANDSFQAPTVSRSGHPSLQRSSSDAATLHNSYKISQIVNLLGRSGSSHLLLGMLTVAPTGLLTISDLSGSITLDLQHGRPVSADDVWFAPGMIVLVDGVYEEEYNSAGGVLGGSGGVGGTIGGRFIGFSIASPPCEEREVTLGISGADNGRGGGGGGAHLSTISGLGWVDYLGVGSEKALGSKMRRLEKPVLGVGEESTGLQRDEGRGRIAIFGEVTLDDACTLRALRKALSSYASVPAQHAPMAIVLMGNFVTTPLIAGTGTSGSVEYKECFNALASILSDFPTLLRSTSFIFVPGDNDAWASAFSGGASTILPRAAVPDIFTSRIKRAFAAANAEPETGVLESSSRVKGGAVWTTNPARLSLFGLAHEMVVFRDDLVGRLRRNAIRLQPFGEPTSAMDEDTGNTNTQSSHTAATVEEAEARPAASGDSDQMHLDAPSRDSNDHITVPPDEADNNAAAATMAEPDLAARCIAKAILNQGYLSPFPLATRPVLWDHASALQLYPLPTALVLADRDAAPSTIVYQGCQVMNPGCMTTPDGKRAQWVEYNLRLGLSWVRQLAV